MDLSFIPDLGTWVQWSGIATLGFFALMVLGFILKWGIRFRLFGVTSFMVVLTVGLFGLSLGLFNRSLVPGSVRYTLVYDNANSQAVIALSPTVTPQQVEATLQQASNDLYSYGRIGIGNDFFTVRARTVIHPETGVSKPLYLGEARRAIANTEDDQLKVEIFSRNFAKLPKPKSS